ncbi:MAG: hypothetical protein ACKO0V_21710, partial [bacterium]
MMTSNLGPGGPTRMKNRMPGLLMAAMMLAAIVAGSGRAMAQAALPAVDKVVLDPLPADMKPYTATIPGTK